jgi:hypothetical protein
MLIPLCQSATVLKNIFEPGIKIDDKVTAIATHRNPIWILPAYSNLEKVLLQQSKKFELHTLDPKNIVE